MGVGEFKKEVVGGDDELDSWEGGSEKGELKLGRRRRSKAVINLSVGVGVGIGFCMERERERVSLRLL